MPQYNSYALITQLLAADIVLVYKDSTGSNKTITAANLAASIKELMDPNFSVTNINSATLLDEEDVFVVGNSASTFTITLPPTVDFPGKPYYIANKGTAAITVAADAADTIIGVATISLPAKKSGLFISDGAGMWHWIGNPA